MSNNKLKNMIENHELDDFVYEEKLKEKLCKLQTSEEVLELLKKYNYNESKEVFEVRRAPRELTRVWIKVETKKEQEDV